MKSQSAHKDKYLLMGEKKHNFASFFIATVEKYLQYHGCKMEQ